MLPLDVTKECAVSACVERVLTEAGRLDVLINNAGIGVCGAVEDTPISDAQAQFDCNYFGSVRMARAVLPHMHAQGAGKILFIGSLAGDVALPFQAHYSASKAAVQGLVAALRLELRASPIEVTAINPGDFATGFTDARRFVPDADSPRYGTALRRTMAIVERDERGGADPQLLADLCCRLVNVAKLKPAYRVGALSQRFAVALAAVLPAPWFERLMAGAYRVQR
jgi:short-subunit dehydrogenase